MPYITPEYYIDEYKGADAGEDLDRYIQRASDMIDQVTNYALAGVEFERLAQFIQDQVKKATAAQVEFYVVLGGSEEVDAGAHDAGQVRVGSFSYGGRGSGGGAGGRGEPARISPTALGFLEPTGLLYRGLDVVDSAY